MNGGIPFVQLRQQCEWYVDYYDQHACCLKEDDRIEALGAAPEVFDCETCPVRQWHVNWSEHPENEAAWRLYSQVRSRFGVDTHTAGEAFRRLTASWSDEEFVELWPRLAAIYDVLSPPTKD